MSYRTPKRGIEWVRLPPELQSTVTRSHGRTVRYIAGNLRSFAVRTSAVGPALEALSGFAEAVRPLKKRRLFDSFQKAAMDVDGQAAQGGVFNQRKRKFVLAKLGSFNPYKNAKLSYQYVKYIWRAMGTTGWGEYEDKSLVVFGGGTQVIRTIGQYPMMNITNVGVNQQSNYARQFFPIYQFSLTNTPNLVGSSYRNVFDGSVYCRTVRAGPDENKLGFYPLYLYGTGNNSSVPDTSFRSQNNDGTVWSDSTHERWDYRTMNATSTSLVPHDYCHLANVNFKLDLWGAKKAPTKWSIMIVQYSDDTGPLYDNPAFSPNQIVADTTSNYVEYDGNKPNSSASLGATAHKSLWNRETNHPWCIDSVPPEARLKVLRSWQYNMAPSYENDEDDRPQNMLLNFTVHFDRQCKYNWNVRNTITNIESTANSIETQQWDDMSVDVHPNARVYLMVKCDNYKRQTAAITSGTTNLLTDDFMPSFNIQIEKTNRISRA